VAAGPLAWTVSEAVPPWDAGCPTHRSVGPEIKPDAKTGLGAIDAKNCRHICRVVARCWVEPGWGPIPCSGQELGHGARGTAVRGRGVGVIGYAQRLPSTDPRHQCLHCLQREVVRVPAAGVLQRCTRCHDGVLRCGTPHARCGGSATTIQRVQLPNQPFPGVDVDAVRVLRRHVLHPGVSGGGHGGADRVRRRFWCRRPGDGRQRRGCHRAGSCGPCHLRRA